MAHTKFGHITRRALLKAGATLPLIGIAAPNVLAQPRKARPALPAVPLTANSTARHEENVC